MRRTGTVATMNLNRGIVAIATEDDGFTIVELLSDWNLEVGDEVSWADGYGLGYAVYENLTKQSLGETFVQDHSVDHANLRQQLFID